jgi:hypothetical protein
MNRNKKGQFARSLFNKWTIGLMVVAGLTFGVFNSQFNSWLSRNMSVTVAAAETDGNALAQEIVAKKVKASQDELLNDLSVKCETKGVAEPDGAILLDSNNQMSIGAFQFQIKTVQHYVSLFEHRQITRVEAIQIAIDHDKAMDLARKIVFTENGGLQNNWVNCTARLDLLPRLQEIQSFSK